MKFDCVIASDRSWSINSHPTELFSTGSRDLRDMYDIRGVSNVRDRKIVKQEREDKDE